MDESRFFGIVVRITEESEFSNITGIESELFQSHVGSSVDGVSGEGGGINLVIFVGVVRVGQEKSPASSIGNLVTVH